MILNYFHHFFLYNIDFDKHSLSFHSYFKYKCFILIVLVDRRLNDEIICKNIMSIICMVR